MKTQTFDGSDKIKYNDNYRRRNCLKVLVEKHSSLRYRFAPSLSVTQLRDRESWEQKWMDYGMLSKMCAPTSNHWWEVGMIMHVDSFTVVHYEKKTLQYSTTL